MSKEHFSSNPNGNIQIFLSHEMPFKRRHIFAFLLDVAHFKNLLPTIRQCRFVENADNAHLVEWEIDLYGIPLKWIERTEIDRSNFAIAFHSEKGDLKTFEGEWQVIESAEGSSKLQLKVELNLGIPLLSHLVRAELEQRVQKHFKTLMAEIEQAIQGDIYRRNLKKGLVKGYAVLGHHANYEHLMGYFKTMDAETQVPSKEFLLGLFDLSPSHLSCDIKPIHSPAGKEVSGYWITCPFIPAMMEVDLERVFVKVLEACRVAQKMNTGVVALGGFTSIVGEQYGKDIRELVSVPVTTGNTYTAALVVRGVLKAAEKLNVKLDQAKLTIVGGSGDIGSACAKVFSKKVRHLHLIGRNIERLEKTKEMLGDGYAHITVGNDLAEGFTNSDIVIAAASFTSTTIDPKWFKSGAIVCDVGYPKNIAYRLGDRQDLLIFAGGLCWLPSKFELGLKADYGLKHDQILYGCFSEAIVLAMAGRYESYSWGRGKITEEKMDEIYAMGEKHGFKLAPFLITERILSEADFDRVRQFTKVCEKS